MKTNNLGCTTPARCDAELPDNPQCAPNYFFGMLLGVEDFRAEQGFHLGQQRRHQRSLHGAGVVAGYGVSFKPTEMELRVAPGQALDALGRDLVLELAQCVSLPLWWQAHQKDDAFHDVPDPNDVTLDLDLMLGYCACLSSPVPAIAEPCAGDASDIAYSRLCESVKLSLQRSPTAPAPVDDSYHLLRMWLTLAPPRLDDQGQPLASDQWLIDSYHAMIAMAPADQNAERQRLLAEVLARSVAELPQALPDPVTDADKLCLALARLQGVHLKQDALGWHVTIASIKMGLRSSLLPSAQLQALLLAVPGPEPPTAGPVVVGGGLTLVGKQLNVKFTQPLAAASMVAGAFAANEFIDGQGWKPFTIGSIGYAPGSTSATLELDRAPTGPRLRLSVFGAGPTPLLGATFIPAGALTPESDGRNLSSTLIR